jgi:PIN domain nuclease of toxin-antitoxin system
MRILIDTHVLVWWFSDPGRLSKRAASIVTNTVNTVLVSAATAWELSIKVNLGKLDAMALLADLPHRLEQTGFTELPVTIAQATRAGLLPLHHRDPFDRLLVAQAQDLGVPILSADSSLDSYDIKRVW